MAELLSYKIKREDIEVQYDIEPLQSFICSDEAKKQTISRELKTVNEHLDANAAYIAELNLDMDRLANHADGIDNIVAVGSGILAGLIDSFWVGQFDLDRGKEWGSEKANNFVEGIAEKTGYTPKAGASEEDKLQGAIKHLEGKFGAPSDSVAADFGSGLQHHLRDFAHHPTPVGLAFSMLTQFTGNAYGTNKVGIFQVVPVTDKTFIGDDFPKKILFGTVFWLLHMVSDMAGSSANPGAGTGLPGPIGSLLKELSALPIFSRTNDDGVKEFSLWISKLFNGTLLAEHDENRKILKDTAMRFDLRAELGVIHELGRQAVPVIINECVVRAFYFIRRLAMEIKLKKIHSIRDLKKIEWKKTLPIKNRTIVRMLTISTGTFTAIDLADAAIRGVIKSGGNAALFAKEFVLRVNFVGAGRFAVAVGIDIGMGIKRGDLRNERIAIMSEQLRLYNAIVYYKQAETWVAAGTAEQTINEAIEYCQQSIHASIKMLVDINGDMVLISSNIDMIRETNPEFADELSELLKWGAHS